MDLDQSALVQFLPLVLIFVVFYFLLIRPQQKKQKDHRAMLDALRRGDRVVTGGGILGTVSKVVSPEEVEVDLAPNVRVRVLRSTITSVLAKPDPAAAREAARGQGPRRRKRSRPDEADKVVTGRYRCVLDDVMAALTRQSAVGLAADRVSVACCISPTGRSC